MRRGILPLLLVLPAVVVAVWLATRSGEDPESADEVGRTPEATVPAPPMLKGTGEAHVPDAEPRPADTRENAETSRRATDTVPTPMPDPAAGYATLVVRVLDEQDRPRSGLRIRLYVPIDGKWQFTHDIRLDATGEVRFEDAYPDTVYLWIDHEDSHRSRRLKLDASSPTEVEVVVPLGGTVTGTARHLEKGVLAGVSVVVEIEEDDVQATYRTVTNAKGRYRLDHVMPGTHGVALTGSSIGYNQRPRASVTVRSVETVEKDILLGRLMIEGRARDEATGQPLPEVRVSVGSLYLPTTTDASGTFRVRDVQPGPYTLYFARDGYLGRRSEEIEVVEGAVSRLEIELQPAGLIVLRFCTPEGGAVTGRVRLRFEAGGEGLSASSPWSTTDGSGVVRYERILPGSYTLHAQVEGYEVDPVKVAAGESEAPIEVVCRPVEREGTPLLRGVVRDARTQAPIPGVSIRSQRGPMEGAISDEQGAYALWWRASGSLRLIVSRDGYGIRFVRGVKVEEGKETVLDFELTPAAVVHLWLTDARGDAVVGSLTLVVSPKERDKGLTSLGTGVTSDAEGHAVYRQIVPGDYKLSVIDEKAGRGEAEALIRPGENTVHIQLKP